MTVTDTATTEVVVQGPQEEIEKAQRVMNETNGQDVTAYSAA